MTSSRQIFFAKRETWKAHAFVEVEADPAEEADSAKRRASSRAIIGTKVAGLGADEATAAREGQAGRVAIDWPLVRHTD
ncbi:hypothetical protein ACFSKW_17065 [Nonomuraea mangrovi]|uniref:Uncharacterized protein n=1 Tax=Nonomuraea mangrovi TaxID=2316207 RepID=A0ABW4SVD1_9ACTN